MMSICKICNKEINGSNLFLNTITNTFICLKCYDSFKIIHKTIFIDDVEVYSLYAYRPPLNNVLMDFKVKNDITLNNVFLSPFIPLLKIKYKGYIILPVPSTLSSNKKRGFNHVIEFVKVLDLKMINVFYKSKSYKQTDKNYEQRKEIHKIIKCNKKIDKNKKYLIVDDVITSGNTIKACINLLKNMGIKRIKVLTLFNNYRN